MGDGKSEGRSVTDRIEVELRQHHLRRKQADFHLVSGPCFAFMFDRQALALRWGKQIEYYL